MKMLADRNIKFLFLRTALFTAVFALLSFLCAGIPSKHRALYVLLSSLAMGICILAAMYRHFKVQDGIMENAVIQLKAYMAGDKDARIECEEEGELYRLFHEVNTLASILNAHAENEKRAKLFMKNSISDISHQLKTPLAALNIYNGIMQEGAGDKETAREFTALSEQELDRIQSLIESLLTITKLDAGTLVLKKKDENISEMMGYIERHFACQARQEKKTLILEGDDRTALLCDRRWLLEAVSNLVKNAFDHTKEGDTVRVEWKTFANVAQITVSDNGCGIHEEDMPHIFKRFYRSRFSKDTRGIGLGLPLAKAIAEAHGGTMETDSQIGRGSCFIMNFLLTED